MGWRRRRSIRSRFVLIGILNGFDESHRDALLPIDVEVDGVDAVGAGARVPLVGGNLDGLDTRLNRDVAGAHLATAVLEGFHRTGKLVDVDYEVAPAP